MGRKGSGTITVESSLKPLEVQRTSALVVIHGEGLGKKHDLVTSSLSIGRASRNDIQVDQESVSRTHAKLKIERERVSIEDNGSTNGTFVNDEQIVGSVELRNGDFINIGRTIFKFIAGNNIEAVYHDEVYRLTTVDGLTQVFNRRYFEDTLGREIARCRRHHRALSLVMIDIDWFKKINDNHGHLAGDAVLKGVSTVIKTRVRHEDVVARYGGEEFVLLLPEITVKGATTLAEKLRRAVEKQTFRFDGAQIPVTISAGISNITKHVTDGTGLVKLADERLYAAKAAGRNQVNAST